jgi:uncharacterized protein
MKILVDRLTDTPALFEFEGDTTWWRSRMPPQRGVPDELGEAFRIVCRAHHMGRDLYLEGQVEGSLELECSRCLARYRHALREPFRLVLEPAGDRIPADPEQAAALARDGVCVGEEFETGWFRGREIHLEAISHEVVSLALPVKPLCREDCAGLCPQCGVDRNQKSCDCGEQKPRSPFAALAALRDGSTGGDR